jgi:microcystin-dependent protein
MATTFVGALSCVPYNFAPKGYAFCAGQIMPISQNTALFSLLGTTYGGDGKSTFALPDLRGRIAISSGQGPGLSLYDLGQASGTEFVSLTQSQIPSHTHSVNATDQPANTAQPSGALLGPAPTTMYNNAGPTLNAPMNSGMLGFTGSSAGHENRMPYLTLSWVIALQGVFPSRS